MDLWIQGLMHTLTHMHTSPPFCLGSRCTKSPHVDWAEFSNGFCPLGCVPASYLSCWLLTCDVTLGGALLSLGLGVLSGTPETEAQDPVRGSGSPAGHTVVRDPEFRFRWLGFKSRLCLFKCMISRQVIKLVSVGSPGK